MNPLYRELFGIVAVAEVPKWRHSKPRKRRADAKRNRQKRIVAMTRRWQRSLGKSLGAPNDEPKTLSDHYA